MNIAGLVLAGGASRRMGQPKALLLYAGETFLDRLIGIFNSVCSNVTVVLGHQPESIRAGLQRRDEASFVVNDAYLDGQLSSLKCGLRAIPDDAAAILYCPVDYPRVEAATVRRLVEAYDSQSLLVAPAFHGKHGHPILFDAKLRSELLSLPVDGRTRDVVHRHRDRTRYVEVGDPGILRDVDDPAAYRELLAERR